MKVTDHFTDLLNPVFGFLQAFKMVSEQFGIQLPDDFVKVPAYEQMNLFDMGMR